MSNYKKYDQTFHFEGNREAVIIRDGEKCVLCEMSREEHREKFNRDITVDHIDGQGRSKPQSEKNNSMSNLRTLCLACHASKDNKYQKLSAIQMINIIHMKGAASHRMLGRMYGVNHTYIGQLQRGMWGKKRIELLQRELSNGK